MGAEQDSEEAAVWYQKAVDAGSVPAMCDLGVCYERGEGVPQDFARAVALYTQAAENGNPPGPVQPGLVL